MGSLDRGEPARETGDGAPMVKPEEFWFDLETTSDRELVVNEIYTLKPSFETAYHVIEAQPVLDELKACWDAMSATPGSNEQIEALSRADALRSAREPDETDISSETGT